MAWLVAVVLVVVAPGLLVVPAAVAADPVVENVVRFSDVPESSQFATEILWLAAEGISTGWDAGGGVRQYRPLESIARDAMAAFLYRHAGSPAFTAPAVSPFTDVPAGAAFYKEITWLASKGISTGWDVGSGKREYRPLSPIARDAMAAFLYRYANKPAFTTPSVSPFGDVPAGGAFYTEITWLAASGISTGWDVGGGVRQYRPLNGIARDAMAAFLYRYAGQKVPADPANPAAGTVTIAPDVEVLEPAQVQSALVSGDTVVLPSDQATDIKPNDVLVSGVTAGTPDGLLARVVQVVRDPDGNTLVKTEPATLPEAVVSTGGLLEVTGTPVSSEFIPEAGVTVTTPAGRANTAARNPELASPLFQVEDEVFSQSFSVKSTFKSEASHESEVRPTSNTLSGSGSVSVASTVRASAKAKMTLEAGFLQLKEASVVMTPSFSAEHEVSVSGGLEGKISTKLGTLKAWLQFWAGPVPVVVTADAEVAANLTVAGEAEISVTSSQTVAADYGFKYRDGSFNLVNTKPQTTGVQNEVKATASLTARLSLDFDADIKLYGVAGITFGAGPYISATIAVVAGNGGPTWSCPIELGLESRLGVVLGVEVMGFKLEQSAVNTTTWKLAEPNPCEGLPLTPPEPKPTPTPTPTPDPVPGSAVRSIEHGLRANYAIRNDGTVWAWGENMSGQLGIGNSSSYVSVPLKVHGLSNIISVSAGGSSAYAIRSDGTLFAWGSNLDGQLGNGTTTDSVIPVQVVGLSNVKKIRTNGSSAIALTTDGSLWSWGYEWDALGYARPASHQVSPRKISGLSGITDIAYNEQASTAYALGESGTVWAWGDGQQGKLGNGSMTGSSVPVQVLGLTGVVELDYSYSAAYARKADGSLWAWGGNWYGQLGNGTYTASAIPTRVMDLPPVTSVKSRGLEAYALSADGSMWAWGYGFSAKAFQVPGHNDIAQIDPPYALKRNGTVWAWGDNNYGSLGDGTGANSGNTLVQVKGITNIKEVRRGNFYNGFAIASDGSVMAWGNNWSGTLGDGTTEDRSTPVSVILTIP
ncbi:alpha-tubulin suppressor-like RCC1 family protein [Paenarthrobacter nicotinovorans]|uniref:RCC1 domain-containing protein n=1 Tax=Paenarthrobacter nicotinovorans TaxID=29320 RepID=UPI0027847BD3|nr:S-layer homology domain-containing protein [Paenarthrobacter nicotinovorans]MDP9936889.1 alpha-tubulin suppressor-like RCC1 family protein [Paenarthrobacter nicotinovorans]